MKLLLSPRFSEDSQKIWLAASARGWEVERLEGWLADGIGEVDAIYGETLWARVIASQVGKELIEPPLDWLCGVPENLLRRKVQYGELRNLKFAWPAFIKPADDKAFPARVYESFTFATHGIDLLASGPVLVSEPSIMLMEFRVWVLNGKSVTGSLYRHCDSIEHEVAQSHLADAFWAAERCAKAPNTPPALVIDVARDINGTWIAVEANPCFGSGLYDANASTALDVLAAACVKEAPPQFVQKATLV